MEGVWNGMTSPYDAQVPSTSSVGSTSVRPNTPQTPFGYGSLPSPHRTPGDPTNPPSKGGLRQNIFATKLAQTHDWIAGAYNSGVSSPRAPSVRSTGSYMTDVSGLSAMTGLSVRTDYTDTEFAAAMGNFYQQENIAPAPENHFSQYPPAHLLRVTVDEWPKPRELKAKHAPIRYLADRKKCNGLEKVDGAMLSHLLSVLFNDVHQGSVEVVEEALVSLGAIIGGKDGIAQGIMCDIAKNDRLLGLIFDRIDVSKKYCVHAITLFYHLLSCTREFPRLAPSSQPRAIFRRKAKTMGIEKKLVEFICYDRDLSTSRRCVAIDCLRLLRPQQMSPQILDVYVAYMYVMSSERPKTPPEFAMVEMMKVEPDERVLSLIVSSLYHLIRKSDALSQRFIDRDGVTILSGWLTHGSTRLLDHVIKCLSQASKSPHINRKDLSIAIQNVLMVLGSMDPVIFEHSTFFLDRVALTNPKARIVIAERNGLKGLLSPILQVDNIKMKCIGWKEVSDLLDCIVNTVCHSVSALFTVSAGRETELAREPSVFECLLRAASFDFLYVEFLPSRAPRQGNGHELLIYHTFASRNSQGQHAELKCKRLAVELICRLASVLPMDALVGHTDPLFGETVVVMCWRRLWEICTRYSTYYREDPNVSKELYYLLEACVRLLDVLLNFPEHLKCAHKLLFERLSLVELVAFCDHEEHASVVLHHATKFLNRFPIQEQQQMFAHWMQKEDHLRIRFINKFERLIQSNQALYPIYNLLSMYQQPSPPIY